jgi:hypothetical protein
MDRASRALAADYDDAPARPAGHPLVRVLRAAGALVTVFIAGTIGALVLLRIEVSPLVYLGLVLLSIMSIPLIVIFWSKEVAWRGGQLSSSTAIFAVSTLTWFAEVLFSGIMLILSGYLFR